MDSVSHKQHDDVAVITIDDGKANALSHAVLDALDQNLARAESEAKAVVLAGSSKMFSGGFDLSVMRSGDAAAVADLVGKGARLAMKLYGLGVPTVAACTGHGVAAGAILLMSSDIRVGPVAPVKIGMIEATIGMPVPVFAVALAQDRLSKRHLTRAILLGETYDGPGAIDAGYLDQLADDPLSAAIDQAVVLAQTISAGALAITRKNVRGSTIEHVLRTLDADLAPTRTS